MSRRISLVTIAIMALGFAYAARATTVRYVAMMTSPFVSHDSSSIDTFLRPARITSAQLRHGVKSAGWRHGDDVVVLAADDAISREDLYQVYYSAGYLLYPSKVRLHSSVQNLPNVTNLPNLTNLTNPTNQNYPVHVLVFGRPNPFNHAQVTQLGEMIALVTLP